MILPRSTLGVGLITTIALIAGTVAPAHAVADQSAAVGTGYTAEVSVSGDAASDGVVTTELVSASDEQLGVVDATIDDGTVSEIRVVVDDDLDHSEDTFVVENLVVVDADTYSATLRSTVTGELIPVDTTATTAQVLPVILGVLAVAGLKIALKQATKAAIKAAAKKYVLSLSSNKWAHIMAPKHRWKDVGAKSKDQVADLIGSAVTNGKATKRANHIEYLLSYKGRTIEVRTSHKGHISDGWVRSK